jgi:hypothetical protein
MAKVKLPIHQRTQLIGGDYGTGDPYWDNVTLLMLFTEQNNFGVTDDISANGFVGTFQNNATIDTTVSRFPGSRFGPSYSATFDGTSDYISIPDNDALSPVSSSFVVECDVRFNGDPTTSQQTFVSKWNNGFGAGSQKEWWVGYRNNSLNAFLSNNGSSGIFMADVAWDPAGDTWYHVAFVFDRSLPTHETRVYVDGTQVGASDTSLNTYASFFNSASQVWIGGYDDDANDWFNGWIDNVRITKGVARYTEAFTPPQAPHPNYKKRGPATSIAPTVSDPYFSSVVLLLPFDGTDADTTTTDYSPSAHSITFFNNAQIDDGKSKFGPTSYIGDGNGDYVTAPDSADWDFGTDDFTIEMWVNFASTTGTEIFCFMSTYLNSTTGLSFQWRNDSFVGSVWTLVTGWGDTLTNSYASDPTVDQWYHIAWAREGTTSRLFLDGALVDSDTDSTNITGGTTMHIGQLRAASPTFSFWGNIDDVRITKGVARYTGAFTPPTQAHPTQ